MFTSPTILFKSHSVFTSHNNLLKGHDIFISIFVLVFSKTSLSFTNNNTRFSLETFNLFSQTLLIQFFKTYTSLSFSFDLPYGINAGLIKRLCWLALIKIYQTIIVKKRQILMSWLILLRIYQNVRETTYINSMTSVNVWS